MAMLSRRNAIAALAAPGLLLRPRGAAAQAAFPSSAIEILVPWGVGGGASQISDLVRTIANRERWAPQPMTITHRPGASGLVGTALVADRRGNPHVFMPGGGALLPQVVMRETPVHPLRDLTPLALSALDSSLVIAPANSRFRTFGDVIEQLKRTPRSVTLAGAGGGPGSWDGMLEVVLGAIAGVQFNQIPFGGGGEVQAAVLGGQIDIGTRQLSNAESLIRSGRLKALAIFDETRNSRLPDVPTMKELGFNVVLNLSRGWFAPAGITPEATAWYANLFARLDRDPTWTNFNARSGIEQKFLGPADWGKFVSDGLAIIDTLYRATGIVR